MQHTVPGNSLPALRAGVFALGLACAIDGVCATNDDAAPDWKFSGFGTVGVVHSNLREADFAASVLQPAGAGRSHPWSTAVDSRLGGQLDLAIDRRWSAVLQLVSEQRFDNSYTPALHWANVKYQATPELALRVGRIALPMFLAADYRRVGYAYPWVRPPVELYGALPVPDSDGVDVAWRWCAGSARHATQAFYGRTDQDLGKGARMRAYGLAGLSHSIDVGAASVRASVISARLAVDRDHPQFNALGQFGTPAGELATAAATDAQRTTLIGLGLSYDPGSWFVMTEGGQARGSSFLTHTSMLYASAGYRHGALTSWFGYAAVRADQPAHRGQMPARPLQHPGPASGRPADPAPQQSTISVGTRWDLHTDVALKLQLERVTPHGLSRGTLVNASPAFRPGAAAQVASATLDFVF